MYHKAKYAKYPALRSEKAIIPVKIKHLIPVPSLRRRRVPLQGRVRGCPLEIHVKRCLRMPSLCSRLPSPPSRMTLVLGMQAHKR